MNPSHRRNVVAVTLAGCDLGTSGVSVFAEALVPRLAQELASRGTDLIVVGTARERRAVGLEDAPGITLPAALDRPAASAAFTLFGAAIVARALGAQVLYVLCANRRIVALPAVKVAGTVHDLAQFHVASKYGALRQVYVKQVLSPLLRTLHVLTTVSQATADDVTRFAGVPAANILVVPNGVTLGQAHTSSASEPYFLYAARLEHPGKNHVRVVEAFARSRARATHRLVFSGADWGAGPRIREAIAAHGLESKVDLIGLVSRDDLTTRMAHADAVIAAGLLEGFGLPAAEAMTLGRPIAASSTGSLPEVVGPLGALFDPTDVASMAAALDRVVEDELLRARCRVEGPERAKRFSWDRAAASIADALQEVVRAAA
jgi:glycosyltransferase involved in cell wall biosynthesis